MCMCISGGALSSATSFESLPSNKDDATIDSRASTPTEHLAESDQYQALKAKLSISDQKVRQLETENNSLRNRVYDATVGAIDEDEGDSKLRQFEERLRMSETMFIDYRDENAVLKAELRELQASCTAVNDDASLLMMHI